MKPEKDAIVPTGTLKRLLPESVVPSRQNPRRLFDDEPLRILKDNIRQHGVLVPITVYKVAGQDKYQILDGERRYKCCIELEDEGHSITIPANIVDPPTKIAGLLYMFSIHNIREAWELMPVALSLKIIMRDLGSVETPALSQLTGLSSAQVERCKTLLQFPERYQNMSLVTNPSERIPANLWIEAYPIFDIIKKWLPSRFEELKMDGICDIWVNKYHTGALKSVLHFRRIVDAAENSEAENRETEFRSALKNYLNRIEQETRATFDTFVMEGRKIETATSACDDFVKQIKRAKIDHIIEKEPLIKSLREVQTFINSLLEKLEGQDAPTRNTLLD